MIKLQDVTHVYNGRVRALDNLSFEVAQGEIVGLLGPNGAGKSTIVRIIMGMLKPTSGTVSVAGLVVSDHLSEVRRRTGFMPQETALYQDLTAQETLEYHAELYGVPRDEMNERIARMLELAGLTERKNDLVKTYSGGMKRRLALVRALLHDSDLVILDEMSLGVDVQSRNLIWTRVREMKQEGRTVLFCTNYMDEAESLADRLVIIDHGRLIAEGSVSELKSQYVGNYLIELLLDTPPRDIHPLIQMFSDNMVVHTTVLDGSTRVVIETDTGPQALPKIIKRLTESGVSVKQVTMREPSLDDVFLSLTGSRLRD